MTKTFLAMRTETDVYQGTTIPIPQDVQTAINDWFDGRRVCDDTNFIRFFQRILNRDYARYVQLLRIEPGVAQYDWLVQQYKEAQHYFKEEESRSENSTGSKTGENSSETAGSKAGSDSGTSSSTSTTETDNTTTNSSSRTGSVVLDGESTRVPDLETVSSGTSTTDSSDRSSTTSSATSNSTAGSKSVGKANPQSISYATAAAGSVPVLDWRFPGTQAQDESATTGSSNTLSSSEGSSSSETETEDTTNERGSETTTRDDTTTTSDSLTGTDILDGEQRTVSSGETGRQSSETSSGTASGEFSEASTSTSEGAGEKEHIDQSIDTGRSEAPAELLRKATAYIKASSSIMWLLDRLEPCFIGVYDV